MQPADTQPQSPLISKLSREIRDLIYLELWKASCGSLRQHIVWHGSQGSKRHFCRWPCCMPPWGPEDELQHDLETMKRQNPDQPLPARYARRLQSPWLNHWACGHDIQDKARADSAIYNRTTTAFGPCWWEGSVVPRKADQWLSPYMPMLLLCKIISAECLESIYGSTTFVFTDVMSYQMFAGFCKLPPGMETVPANQPPAFFKHTRKLEISLNANFAKSIPCTDVNHPVTGPLHDAFDFHWLQLDRFDNLVDLKIWVTSRVVVFWQNPNRPPVRTPLLVDLKSDVLSKALQKLSVVKSVDLSTPLHQDVKTKDLEEDGLVEGIAPKNVHLWKRGTGDRFHPYLGPIKPGGTGDGLLLVSGDRHVKEAPNSRAVESVHVSTIT